MKLLRSAGQLIIPLVLCASAIPALGAHAAALAQPRSASLSRCFTNQLTIQPVSSSGAAGHIALLFRIHNYSNTACLLYGYPGAQLLTANKQNMPTHVHRGPPYFLGIRSRLVRLAPGGNAYFVFEWSHIPSGSQPCPTARYVRITPPNDYSSLLVRLGPPGGIDACAGAITATPVVSYRIGI